MKTTAAILALLPALAAADPSWTWHQDGNRSIELRGATGPIVRFLLDCAPRDPHFDLLATPDGRNTVWVAPGDHVWHYGLWFSWKLINGVNFWETNQPTGLQDGRSEIADPQIESAPDAATATIRFRDLAHPTAGGPAVLEDAVVIRITRPRDGNGPQVQWTMKTTALEDVELSRTPLPDEPDGKAYGGYGGFSWRGAKDFKDVRFTDSEGRQDMALHRQHARWVELTGSLGGKPAGLTVLSHPLNPGHPASWYLVATPNPQGPFWFVNPTLVQPKPIHLKKGESFTHSYQISVNDGNRPADAARKEAEIFGTTTPLAK
jgi:hypothetical protein